MSDQEHPTVEQSLHSIALSLIEMNRYNREQTRTQKKTLRQNIRVADAEAFRATRDLFKKKKTVWGKLKDFMPSFKVFSGGGTAPTRRGSAKPRSRDR
jgi:hypothetical protein